MSDETQANRPAAEPSQSFRERTAERLQTERADRLRAEREEPAEAQPANLELDLDPELDDEPTGLDTDPGAIDTDGDDDDPEHHDWRRAAEEAIEAKQSMERDYRRKTHRIAQTVDELRERVVEASATHEVLLREAQAEMLPFEGVDWGALQQDPARYQQAAAAYTQAQQRYQRRVAEAEQLKARRQQMYDDARKKQAEVSQDILRSQLPGWSGEMYQAIREFAVEQFDYTPQEVDEQVDWRWVMAMDAARRALRRPGVKGVRETAKPPTNGKNRPAGRPRDAKGKYQSARQAAFDRPGDRSAFRQLQQAKLRAEREG